MTYAEVLATSQVPHTNVFFLGCFEGRVTLFAQQIRAFNLIDAIVAANLVPTDGRIAVVGGGASGMTAAAALATLAPNLKTIDLYERKDRWMHLQQDSPRYLHPHLYDWPNKDATEKFAGFRILNWQAQTADNVAKQIIREFRATVSGSQIQPNLEAEVVRVELGEHGRWRVVLKGPRLDAEDYDAVILSIGFGYEKRTQEANPSYWKPSKFSGAHLARDLEYNYFISGNGDGGLVEFIEAAYADGHRDISEYIAGEDRLNGVEGTLKSIEEEARMNASFDIFKAYKTCLLPLLPGFLKQAIQNRLRSRARILFHIREKLVFRCNTSMLNRFAAYLAIEYEPSRFQVVFGKKIDKLEKDSVHIGGQIFQFYKHICRFGPDIEENIRPFKQLANELLGSDSSHFSGRNYHAPSLTPSADTFFKENRAPGEEGRAVSKYLFDPSSLVRQSAKTECDSAQELLGIFFQDIRGPSEGAYFLCKGLRAESGFPIPRLPDETEFLVAFIEGRSGKSSLPQDRFRELMHFSAGAPVMIVLSGPRFFFQYDHVLYFFTQLAAF